MSLGRASAVSLVGLNGSIVDVEADIGGGLPAFILLGLPDASLAESKDRIRSAARNSGIELSPRRITVNLVPASLPKRGSGFDLAIVVAALAAAGEVRPPRDAVFLAELGLDGCLRPVQGVLPAVMAAVAAGRSDVVVAAGNRAEAELVSGATVHGYAHLSEVLHALGADPARLVRHHAPPANPAPAAPDPGSDGPVKPPDLADLSGQHEARFALEVAAAGGHHLMMVGPPGAGKTMLAERLPGILPELDDAEALETTAVHSLAGGAGPLERLIRRPPFESPHHSATMASLIGGGSGLPRPGAASRAHRGVLFLDEAPEFSVKVLDALRQPLESGRLTLHRAAGSASYPARFQLVLAANPCPCGMSVGKGLLCTCSTQQRRRYFGRLSGPLLDRIDLQVQVPRVTSLDLAGGSGEDSSTVAGRVAEARRLQRERLAGFGLNRNAELGRRELAGELAPERGAAASLGRLMDEGRLTARGHGRVLRIAWTVADLRGAGRPGTEDVEIALHLRQATGEAA
ncbi:YifB family Mg chelatase-like AAA ATPase [Zafaria sp. Z1313]|uniref:YifB family Mg chelatase-like AAA ATPase n=1 Tax=Zafaria sp. Z1313 TaxID=3423202 RepID=UPI003D303491